MERKNSNNCLSYQEAGVNIAKEKGALGIFLDHITKTFSFIPKGPGHVLSTMGYFANLIEISDTISLAVSADGVGTKVLIAQMMNKYDTVGIDCIAMNVNDIICVGAKPISFLNYIALQDPQEDLLDQLGKKDSKILDYLYSALIKFEEVPKALEIRFAVGRTPHLLQSPHGTPKARHPHLRHRLQHEIHRRGLRGRRGPGRDRHRDFEPGRRAWHRMGGRARARDGRAVPQGISRP